MAITNTTNSVISGGTGATIGMWNSNTSVYNIANDFIYGIPSHEWHRLSAMDQRYYAEMWHEREQKRMSYEHSRNPLAPENRRVTAASEPMKPYAPEYMTNKLLLLEN